MNFDVDAHTIPFVDAEIVRMTEDYFRRKENADDARGA